MYTLGIETSCDETAVSVLKDNMPILSQLISSQIGLHKSFGGVIPELASRRHLEVITDLVTEAVKKAGINLKEIGLISVTQGPGLAGALLIGLSYAKALSYSLKVPIIGVNHIEAHLYAGFMEYPESSPPCIGLVISGGHTALIEIYDIGKYTVLGQTLDDAAGEAFDKVGKILGLEYPGGPVIDKLSKYGNPDMVRFPRAMAKHNDCDFSFSGLKTSVVYYVKGLRQYKGNSIQKQPANTADLAASFQEAAVDQIIKKTTKAMNDTGYKILLIGGGVARNSRLRYRFKQEADKKGWKIYIPQPLMCTDNGAMIAGLGYARYKKYGPSPLTLDALPRMGWEY